MQQPRRSRPWRWCSGRWCSGRRLTWLWLPLVAACYAAPQADDRSFAASCQRTFAADLSQPGFARRTESIGRGSQGLASELSRSTRLPTAPLPWTVGPAPQTDLPTQLATDLQTEAARLPQLTSSAAALASRLFAPQAIGTATDTVPTALGLDRAPLGDPDDAEHRTDPSDQQPEATLWQRLRRRLPF